MTQDPGFIFVEIIIKFFVQTIQKYTFKTVQFFMEGGQAYIGSDLITYLEDHNNLRQCHYPIVWVRHYILCRILKPLKYFIFSSLFVCTFDSVKWQVRHG